MHVQKEQSEHQQWICQNLNRTGDLRKDKETPNDEFINDSKTLLMIGRRLIGQ